MKKLLALLLAGAMVFSLAACGDPKEEKEVSTFQQAGGGSAVVKNYRQGMAPSRENSDGTITFGDPSGKADVQITD